MLPVILYLFAFSVPLAQAPAPVQPPEVTVVLEGQVVDLRGEPVPAASVEVVPWQQRDQMLARTVCDGEGFFKVGHVPKRGPLIVRVHADGYCNRETGVSNTPKPLRIAVHDAATVRGVLNNRNGAPVAGATVRAFLIARDITNTEVDATTDADGRFTLGPVPLGYVRFAAVVAGEGLVELRTVIAGNTEVTIASERRPTTSLRVLVEGMPEAAMNDLRLSILPYDSWGLCEFPPPWNKPVFDDAGRFELQQVPDLRYSVSPRAVGFAFSPRTLVVQPGQGPHELKFTAVRMDSTALQCPARVCDGAGKPVVGVRLAVRAANGADVAEATSGQDGTLAFASPVAAGTEVIVYSLDDRFVLDQSKDQGIDGRELRSLVDHQCKVDPEHVLDLRVAPACSVMGRVLLADGRPAAFVDVHLEAQNDHPMVYATTDRSGAYAFPRRHHLPQNTRVSVAGWCGAAESEFFTMAAAGTHVAVPDLKLAPPATVEGTVVDAWQKPAPGVRVWLGDWDFTRHQQQSGSVVEVITDRKGRYRFLGVPPGGAWLRLLSDGDHPRDRAGEPFEVAAGKSYTFELQIPKAQ